jgi:hypothetical protein
VLSRRLWSDEHRFEKYLEKRNYEIHRMPKDEQQNILSTQFKLRDIGIERIEIVLDKEKVHRVFNRKSFKYGGRGFGAIHQRIPKKLRPYIHINGQPTVELDYSAFHIRMLYHLKGIDYRDDPFEICEGPDKRSIYKAVGLIAINGDEKKPYKVSYAIRYKLIEMGIPLPIDEKEIERFINLLINRFRDAHPDIADCLYNDKGIHLMNIDSRIMNNILMKLIDQGILGLSVYDSIIVAEQHQDYLYQLMMDEYEKEMGFKPMVEVKKKP